jgi:hypothetical protein
MGSPRTKDLFQRAIAESEAWIGLSVAHTSTLAETEQGGVKTTQRSVPIHWRSFAQCPLPTCSKPDVAVL